MSRRLTQIIELLVVLFIPIVVIGGATNLLATDEYLTYEYGKSTFPPDTFGFTPQLRFILASSNIHYVRAHLPEDEVSKQTLNGLPIYSSREVSHMADVQAIFQSVFRVWQAASILVILMGAILAYRGKREALAAVMRLGGLLTSTIVLVIALLGLFAWQFWFNTFHLFFFKPGSWLFSYSDTLIRLFPEEFWFDATLTISILSLAGGLVLTLAGWRWQLVSKRTV